MKEDKTVWISSLLIALYRIVTLNTLFVRIVYNSQLYQIGSPRFF